MLSRLLGTRPRILTLIGLGVILVGATVVPPLVPVGLVVLGVAFADFRWNANKGQVMTRRLVIVALVAALVMATVSTVLATVPALQTDWETHGPFDVLITILVVIQIVGWIWLPLMAGYFGMALWMRWRYGPDGEPEDD